LEYNDSRLRRKIEERDRLLASKEKDFADQIARQKKVNNNLLTQLIGMLDNLGEETVQQLAEAKKKTETRDVGCGSDDEPIQPLISELEEPQIHDLQTTVPVIPVEMAIPDEPENVSSSLPETEVRPAIDGGERDDESSFVKEVPVSQPEIVAGQFQPSEAPPPVLPPATEYVVRSDIMHFTTDYSITVRGIPTGQIGLVIGHRGRNMLRLERGYGVGLRFVEGTLYITGGDQRRRQDALKDVVENLPIVLECPFLPLEDHERINNLLINGLSFEYNVTICRPSARNKTGTILGRIDRCKTVYHLLKKASSG
jgi:PII-like signaling protein